jgi:hypothetical protein
MSDVDQDDLKRLRHAKYEFVMARYCIDELQKPQLQAQWNVLLAAFGVYFRNCQQFFKWKR